MLNSALLSVVFAGCALSSPLFKRDQVVEVNTVFDVVYVTQYATATASNVVLPSTSVVAVQTSVLPSTSTLPVESAAAPVVNDLHLGRPSVYSWGWTSTFVYTQSETPVPVAPSSSSVYVPPPSSAPAAPTSSAAEVSFDSSDLLQLQRRAGTPTCNPNNVRILTNYFPSPTAYCKRLQAAMPTPTNKIAPNLNLKQSNNICSCVLAGSYVSNTPLTAIKVLNSHPPRFAAVFLLSRCHLLSPFQSP